MIFLSNTRLVAQRAKFFSRLGVDLPDLIQEGNIGLAKAIQRFDIQKGFKFSTYATWWVNQAMGRSLADKSRLIRLPANLHDVHVKLNRTAERLREELSREPTLEELSKETGLKLATVQIVDRFGSPTMASIDSTLYDEGPTLLELHPNDSDPIEDFISTTFNKQLLNKALAGVKNHQQLFAISLKYGVYFDNLRNFEANGRKYDEIFAEISKREGKVSYGLIGSYLGLSHETVRKMYTKGLNALKHSFFEISNRS